MVKRFEDSKVFITGASSGIGAALALHFASQGAHVALAARREDRLRDLKKKVETEGGHALAIPCDVTDRASIDNAVAEAASVMGGVDVAIANAGFGVNGLFTKLETEDFRRQFDTNFYGVVDTTYAVLPHLRASRGRLGIVSSVMGRVGAPASSAYCASKFALCGLAESIYYELAAEGVSVTLINPGVVASGIRFVDNQGVYREGGADPAPSFLVVPVERAAKEIAAALYRRRFEAVITGHGKIITWAARHFPRSFRLVGRLATSGRLESVEKRKRTES